MLATQRNEWQPGCAIYLMNLADLKWTDVAALDRNTPVVFPVAALEQHGHHLPLFTDSMLLGEVVRRAVFQVRGEVLVAPLTWLGNSEHHLDFPGTLSATPRGYLDLLNGLVENFLAHGFKRIVFLNGHGGNDIPGRQALFEVRQRHRSRSGLLLLFATYWHLAPRAEDCFPGLKQHEMGHACEWETSMILRLSPQLVGPIADIEPVEFGTAFEPAYRSWITQDRTTPGHIGFPHVASAEKGEALFAAFAEAVGRFLQRVADWDGTSWNG